MTLFFNSIAKMCAASIELISVRWVAICENVEGQMTKINIDMRARFKFIIVSPILNICLCITHVNLSAD